jgi:putative heme-binding domain-containing protein
MAASPTQSLGIRWTTDLLPYLTVIVVLSMPLHAADLQQQLVTEDAQQLVQDALQSGDPQRGAIVFHQPYMACVSCHDGNSQLPTLGPDLARIDPATTDTHLVRSVLLPSEQLKDAYRTVILELDDGRTLTGLVVEQTDTTITLRDAQPLGPIHRVDRSQIEQQHLESTSLMPAGLVNQLSSRQQFLDLISYLIAIRDGGPRRQLELRPPASAYALRPLPAYESTLDHAGMIRAWDDDSLERGRAIYTSLCVNCHGTRDTVGSMPTSLRFASGQFKNGSDPHSIYQTLTKGFGMMAPQTWMVPQQKYDVIHYLRREFLEPHNPSQFVPVDDTYLASLPVGDSRGPSPSRIEPWKRMDYGPNLVGTYEAGSDGTNFAYKGNAIRLDAGPGGASHGQHWTIFDYDTLRVSAAWSGETFIDWNGIHFNGAHGTHPRIGSAPTLANPTGPGWADPRTGSFVDDQRVLGRDARRYGPLPRAWAQYQGMRYHGHETLIEYTVGDTEICELPGVVARPDGVLFTRTLNLGPAPHELVLRVARHSPDSISIPIDPGAGASRNVVVLGPSNAQEPADTSDSATRTFSFDGSHYLQIDTEEKPDWGMQPHDFTVIARIKTSTGGTIVANTLADSEWVPDGQTWFIRDGRLVYDIGWVGAVQSQRRVNDGRWHWVAMTSHDGRVGFWIDGESSGGGELRVKNRLEHAVVRIGYTAPDFPQPQSAFEGDISEVRWYDRALAREELQRETLGNTSPPGSETGTEIETTDVATSGAKPRSHWRIDRAGNGVMQDLGPAKQHARVMTTERGGAVPSLRLLVAGVIEPDAAAQSSGATWETTAEGDLRLHLPASKQSRRLTLWTAATDDRATALAMAENVVIPSAAQDLQPLRAGGPPRWPDTLTMPVTMGDEQGAFAVDTLQLPLDNPWFCRMRLSGLDFLDNGDTLLACDWDGNVWRVDGLNRLPATTKANAAPTVTWRRVASGLFQPLGIKVIDSQVYVTCRDQLCRLHDMNGDGEFDYFESFNNDHQVTEHFHEFAMGLQVDDDGTFYYAKSARHALPALVPHHGTLLRVTPDGQHTEIVAYGFRAANGVCLNPDGSFFVTDQEGHWNPKNRINWVTPGGFYGNMMGYHDVQDASDDAMQQPLCWITNAFDRSPAELLWCASDQRWGPLSGSLLSLSYGNGKVFVVPHEKRDGQLQGGMCELPIPQFPTGVMRGRFHPTDGQLYVCGMTAWATDQPEPGGLYRIRATGKPMGLPTGFSASGKKLALTFTEPLDNATAMDLERYSVRVWSLKRSANYGSPHENERTLHVTGVERSSDGHTVTLSIPDLAPTWCIAIKYDLALETGERFRGTIHGTIHTLEADR